MLKLLEKKNTAARRQSTGRKVARRSSVSRRIVVIEDDRGILQMLRDLLELEGFSVLGLSDPTLIQTIKPSLSPDLFLIDMMLPGMSGIEVAEQMKERFPNTPMVAMSASKLMMTLGAESGMFDQVVDKPFDLAELLACAAHYASQPASADRT
jgi:two-component system response regulator MtrA